ncbi:MAG: serine/threonine protein kinase [Deltaproteobacteria bacterium]|nr:serine/threonine protein kinase [Deltaproteobacteria bacterium]
MRICPGCRASYEDDQARYCPQDGLPLLEISKTFAAVADESLDLSDGAGVEITDGMMIGEYQVERTIAHGGMGVVYSAIHPVIHKRVAIKVLNLRYASDPKAVARFVLEARSVNQIGHHNIVDIFSIGELDDGRNYMVMELLDGLGLHEVLLNATRLEPAELLPVFEQLCDALDAAHSKNFIHRDLKPDNIVILRRPPRPQVKILDFGIAKLRGAASGETEVGTVLGTPEYMAPEQCRGDELDRRVDIYALGILLYELLVGNKPFSDPSPYNVLKMQVREAPPPPSRFISIHPQLEQLILRAMAKHRDERPPTAGALLAELQRAIGSSRPWTASLDPPAEVHRRRQREQGQQPAAAQAAAMPPLSVPPPVSELVPLAQASDQLEAAGAPLKDGRTPTIPPFDPTPPLDYDTLRPLPVANTDELDASDTQVVRHAVAEVISERPEGGDAALNTAQLAATTSYEPPPSRGGDPATYHRPDSPLIAAAQRPIQPSQEVAAARSAATRSPRLSGPYAGQRSARLQPERSSRAGWIVACISLLIAGAGAAGYYYLFYLR